MKETTKNKISEVFLTHLEKKYPELSESQRWKIGSDLAKMAYEILMQVNHDTAEAYSNNVLELEQHRKQYKDHIEFLDKSTKIMLESFKRQGFVKVGEDRKTNKRVLIGRTSMVTEMVEFLNNLNTSVMEFYKNVYKIENEGNQQNFSTPQTTLF